jgi:hypothetical protein
MIRTLLRHIFIEQLKVMFMTILGLSVVVVLCGGLVNIARSYGASINEILTTIRYTLPVAITLILPFAALFSTTAVYGRMAADNEIDACRASGINVLKLLASTAAIGVATVLLTIYSYNFMIPGFVRELEGMIRKDLPVIFYNEIRKHGHMSLGKLRFYADEIQDVTTPKELKDGKFQAVMSNAAFFQLDDLGTSPQLYGAAKVARLWLDQSQNPPRAIVRFEHLTLVDREQDQQGAGDQQEISFPLNMMESNREEKVKWLTLPDLFRLSKNPGQLRGVEKEVDEFYRYLQCVLFHRDITTAINQAGSYRLLGEDFSYEIEAERAVQNRDGVPTLHGVEVTRTFHDGRYRRWKAKSALLMAREAIQVSNQPRILSPGYVAFSLHENVQLVDSSWDDSDFSANDLDLERPRVPERIIDAALAISEAELADPNSRLPEDRLLPQFRAKLINKISLTARQIRAEIHTRFAYCTGTIWLVLLGAGLAIVFRGGHLLMALLLSFLPSIAALVFIVAGRNLSQNAGTEDLGIATIWLSNLIVIVLDIVVLGKFLRR